MDTQTRLGERPDVDAWIAQVADELKLRRHRKNAPAADVRSRRQRGPLARRAARLVPIGVVKG